MEKIKAGTLLDGTKVTNYVLTNSLGDRVVLSEYGARLVSWEIVTPAGDTENMVSCPEELSSIEKSGQVRGATVGPVANRIGEASFRLDDKYYMFNKNNGNNLLHSGDAALHTICWETKKTSNDSVTFYHEVKDKADKFPGHRKFSVTYSLDQRSLSIHYHVETDQDTPVALTNHAFFTLGEEDNVDALELELNASYFTPVDDALIPTGEVLKVEGSDFDFRTPRVLNTVKESEDPRIKNVGGLDHNFIVDQEERGEVAIVGRVINHRNSLQLACFSSEPGVQVYMEPYTKVEDKNSAATGLYRAICLETQHFPDAVNIPHFPSPILRAGQSLDSYTYYSISPYSQED